MPEHVHKRKAFVSSREMDFFTKEGLVRLVGQRPTFWQLVVLKELVDNALDACEEAGIAPIIMVSMDRDGIKVCDNGPGLPAETIQRVQDFQRRISSRAAYVAPDRGAQGNALKTIVAMPYVLHDGAGGGLHIHTGDQRHTIRVRIDELRQEPRVDHVVTSAPEIEGTAVYVEWAESIKLEETLCRSFERLAWSFACLNPHLTLGLDIDGYATWEHSATDPDWKKWRSSDASFAHWYTPDRLRTLIGSTLAHDEGETRSMRDFISQFQGLNNRAKQKKVLDPLGLNDATLEALVEGTTVKGELTGSLLTAMQEGTRPISTAPKALSTRLGAVGEDHFGALIRDGNRDCFRHERKTGITKDGLPWLIEAAFFYSSNESEGRTLVTGINWSAAISNPFEMVGTQKLDALLSDLRVRNKSPVTLVVHLIMPGVHFTDTGKSKVFLPYQIGDELAKLVKKVTKLWTKQAKIEEWDRSARWNRSLRLIKSVSRVSQKAAAFEIMEEAYMKASSNGALPAKTRQIMYAARDHIQTMTGEALSDRYFTGTLWPEYERKFQPEWAHNVIFDARGHLHEPHADRGLPLGTSEVRKYITDTAPLDFVASQLTAPKAKTSGPDQRYQAVLHIEKEGFDALISAFHLAEHYDIANMSTKGFSSVAARELIDHLCGDLGLPLFVMHDFDKAGIEIMHSLTHDNARYGFRNQITPIDVGLRLHQVEALNLESEAAARSKTHPGKIRQGLLEIGASEAEAEFLLERRVELNALTSRQFLDLIEGALQDTGIEKIVPSTDSLGEMYRRQRQHEDLQEAFKAQIAETPHGAYAIPADLEQRVRDYLQANPAASWDKAVADIARTDVLPKSQEI